MIVPEESVEYIEEGDGKKRLPCPAQWFTDFSLTEQAAEVLKCKVWEVDSAPLQWKLKAMAYIQVKNKTRPAVERIAKAKAEAESKGSRATMKGGRSKSLDIAGSRRR